MKILVLGGTRFFGIPMVKELIKLGHSVTIATRQLTKDDFGDAVERITVDHTDLNQMKKVFTGKRYDVVFDKIAYCSNDVKITMESIESDKYIIMSSTAVYDPKKINTKEEDFDGNNRKLVWCSRMDFPYAEIKRQAECALCQQYSDRRWIAVRYPFVIGQDDYTKRLLFYVEHTMKSIAMNIDNLDCQMGFIRSDEAGKFLAFFADKEVTGAFNGCSYGTISLQEIISYVEKKTQTKAIISITGEDAPYNGEVEYSINTDKAKELGFQFSNLKDWIYELLDYYIECVSSK